MLAHLIRQSRIDGREIVLPFLVINIDNTLCGKEHGIPAISGGHHTIKHIHSQRDAFQQVPWSTYSHQVAGFVFRQEAAAEAAVFIDHFGRLSHTEPADRIAYGVFGRDEFGRCLAQVCIGSALYDREKILGVSVAIFGFR